MLLAKVRPSVSNLTLDLFPSDTEVMREVKGLRADYESLDKQVGLREEAIQEMYEIIRQYNERNKDLQTLLDWSRPIKSKLQEPIPDITDVPSLQAIINDHKVNLFCKMI